MSGLTLYGIASCDSCRKARRALEGAGHRVAFHDVRAAPLPAEAWDEMLAALGPGLVNRRSPSWRGLSEALQAAPPAAQLAAMPVLMKRPVIRSAGGWHLGWGPQVQAALL